MGGCAVGQEIKGAAGEQCRIEVSGIQEALQGEGTVLGRAKLVQVGFIDDEVLVRGILIAAGQGAGFELAVEGAAFFLRMRWPQPAWSWLRWMSWLVAMTG